MLSIITCFLKVAFFFLRQLHSNEAWLQYTQLVFALLIVVPQLAYLKAKLFIASIDFYLYARNLCFSNLGFLKFIRLPHSNRHKNLLQAQSILDSFHFFCHRCPPQDHKHFLDLTDCQSNQLLQELLGFHSYKAIQIANLEIKMYDELMTIEKVENHEKYDFAVSSYTKSFT